MQNNDGDTFENGPVILHVIVDEVLCAFEKSVIVPFDAALIFKCEKARATRGRRKMAFQSHGVD